MATAGKGQNKSAFLRDLFEKNPAVKEAEATEAWQKAGNEGEIGGSLYYNVKRAIKGVASATAAEAPKPRARPVKAPKSRPASHPVDEARAELNGEAIPSPTVSRSKTGERERVLDRVEDGIDDLIIELKQLGGMEEALESLKKVRRVVVRSHEG